MVILNVTIKADNILKLGGLGLFCYFRFINQISYISLKSRLLNYKLIQCLSDYESF